MPDFTSDDLKRIAKTLLENNEGSPGEEDSFYVYMLAIKGNESIRPFYIGKGKDVRVFSYENGAESVISSINENNEELLGEEISNKIRMIIKNKENGQSIEKYIIK